jgi:hypothetical protein
MNPYEMKRARNSHGLKAEKRLAKRAGGRSRPGSGAIAGAKGDIVFPDFLMEVKSTVHGSMSIKQEWLRKIQKEALTCGKSPALTIQFVDVFGRTGIVESSWVMMTESQFLEFRDIIRQAKARA